MFLVDKGKKMSKPLDKISALKHFVNNDKTREKLENLGLSDDVVDKVMDIFYAFVEKRITIEKEAVERLKRKVERYEIKKI